MRPFLVLAAAGLSLMGAVGGLDGSAQAATAPTVSPAPLPCGRPIPAATYGQGTYTAAIPAAGNYYLWSRIQAASLAGNAYYLDVFGCGSTVSTTVVGSWVWVRTGPVALPAGNQTVTLAGIKPDLKIDRLIFTTDQVCAPQDIGNNCAGTTPTPTPVGLVGDLNHDGVVNIFDLSALLAKWGTADSSSDLNHSGKVDVFDLSLLLSHWSK